MTTLENLYYGNIDPANKYIKRGSEYSKLINCLYGMKKNYYQHSQKSRKSSLKSTRIALLK